MRLEKFGNILESKIKQLKDEIKQLEKFLDNLKSCGNCYYEGNGCITIKKLLKSHGYCLDWKFDGIQQKNCQID